jgi:hypothetical protein
LMVPKLGRRHIPVTLYRSDLVNLALDIYSELANRTSIAMGESLGEKGAEEALRQEWEHVGHVVPLNIMERMGLKDRGFIVAGFCNLWADSLLGVDQKAEVTAIGIRARARSCPLSNGSFAFCSSHLEVSVARLCELISPGHHSVSRKYLSKGDDHCEILFLSDSSEPDDIWKAPAIASILPPPIEEEERIFWSHSYLSNCWFITVKAMIEALGPEATMEILVPVHNKAGADMAPRIKEVIKFRVDDLESVAKGIDELNSAFLIAGKLSRTSDLEFERLTTECPLWGEVREACSLYESFCQGLVKGLNPAFEYACLESKSTGAKDCRCVIRDKREKATKLMVDQAPIDPFTLLSVRYVKGEISDEEYEKKMAMLKKHRPNA